MVISERRRIVPLQGLAPNFAVATAAMAFPLLASLVNLLRYNEYPLLAAEVWPLYLGVLVAAGVAGAVYLVAPRVIRVAIEVLLVAAVVDLSSKGSAPVALGAAATLLVSLVARRSLAPQMAFAGAVLLALCAAGIGSQPPKTPPALPLTSGSARPVLLHLILDEHIGVAGLPAENAATPQRRRTLKALYAAQGFHMYGGAYSQYMRTTSAIPQILNLGARQPIRVDNRGGDLAVRNNAYFDRLRELGYNLRVYQSTWVDLCAHDPRMSCVRYPQAGLKALVRADLSASDKTRTILINFLARSGIVRRIARTYDRNLAPQGQRLGLTLHRINLPIIESTAGLEALRASDRLIADLSRARPGEAYVAHLLFPHYPYLTRPDCSLKPRREWLYRKNGGGMRAREDAYFEQVLCAAKTVREAMSAIERSPAGHNYVVIVHSDHGGRITVRDPFAGSNPPPSNRDLIASYSTFFAVKGPGVEPGYNGEPVRVDDLLGAFAKSAFNEAPRAPPGEAPIFLNDERWRPAMATHMPKNWANSP